MGDREAGFRLASILRQRFSAWLVGRRSDNLCMSQFQLLEGFCRSGPVPPPYALPFVSCGRGGRPSPLRRHLCTPLPAH